MCYRLSCFVTDRCGAKSSLRSVTSWKGHTMWLVCLLIYSNYSKRQNYAISNCNVRTEKFTVIQSSITIAKVLVINVTLFQCFKCLVNYCSRTNWQMAFKQLKFCCDFELIFFKKNLVAHSAVLSSSSSVLHSMITGINMKLPLQAYSRKTIQQMVEYLYTGE